VVIRSRKSKESKHNGQKLEDTKGLIRSRKSENRIQLTKVRRYQRGNQKP